MWVSSLHNVTFLSRDVVEWIKKREQIKNKEQARGDETEKVLPLFS